MFSSMIAFTPRSVGRSVHDVWGRPGFGNKWGFEGSLVRLLVYGPQACLQAPPKHPVDDKQLEYERWALYWLVMIEAPGAHGGNGMSRQTWLFIKTIMFNCTWLPQFHISTTFASWNLKSHSLSSSTYSCFEDDGETCGCTITRRLDSALFKTRPTTFKFTSRLVQRSFLSSLEHALLETAGLLAVCGNGRCLEKIGGWERHIERRVGTFKSIKSCVIVLEIVNYSRSHHHRSIAS